MCATLTTTYVIDDGMSMHSSLAMDADLSVWLERHLKEREREREAEKQLSRRKRNETTLVVQRCQE